jgi:hypothetical protein
MQPQRYAAVARSARPRSRRDVPHVRAGRLEVTPDLADILERSIVLADRFVRECERRMQDIESLSEHQLQTITGIVSKMQRSIATAATTRVRIAQAGKAFDAKLSDAERRNIMVEWVRGMSREQRAGMLERLRELA